MKFSSRRGISIVEIVVAAAIISISVVGIVGAIQVYLKIVYQNTRQTQAVLLLDETAEAIQSIRDQDYSSIADLNTNTTYTVFWNGSAYQIGTSPITLQYNMTRTFTLEDIKRNSQDVIVQSGTIDPNTKKAVITIKWPYKDSQQTLTSEVLIHNLYDN